MSHLFESLEDRKLFAAIRFTDVPHASRNYPSVASTTGNLTADEVRTILAQAGSQILPTQAVAVSDREGFILGIFAGPQATDATITAAGVRARTGGYFQSTQNAFSTRTARFIIQDNFPTPVRNTGAGPLYGVQFSTLRGSDIVSALQTPGVSGDPGGLPLYKKQGRTFVPVGGIGVAGDGSDTAARPEFAAPGQRVFAGREEKDFDEAVALAGQRGFTPPSNITANNIFLPGTGLRFPYIKDKPARANPTRTLDQLITAGTGNLAASAFLQKAATVVDSVPPAFPAATFSGIPGQLKNTTTPGFGIIASDDTDAADALLPETQRLTVADVEQAITQAVKQATVTRAAIRLPIGASAVIHVAVTDRDGTVLGVFRMNDGTNFSFDVAVQKARTAAFFSDDTHAFSTRAIGFMSQKFFPAGINGGTTGPLFLVQNELSTTPGNLTGPIANGITIFPGGVPLYKNGVLVGAIGISGDGVEQDDIISLRGADGKQPNFRIRSDELSSNETISFITGKVTFLRNNYTFSFDPVANATVRFERSNFQDFRLPYIKEPRAFRR
jgi:uncharacterized protein GlcG (DUF336 family)